MDRRGSPTHVSEMFHNVSQVNRNRMLSIRVCFEEELATYRLESSSLLKLDKVA